MIHSQSNFFSSPPVTGLPDPRKDHATAMVRFAKDMVHSMATLTKKMEVTLGPDTGDLGLRVGLHRYVCFRGSRISICGSRLPSSHIILIFG